MIMKKITQTGLKHAIVCMGILASKTAVAIITAFLLIPIILLPLVTSVSATIMLVLLCLATVSFFLSRRMKKWSWPLFFSCLIVLNVAAVILSQVLASTPPIRDALGNPVPGSIAVLEKVRINGTEQWITIRGKSQRNPVLLYLGIGGPGAGGFPASAMNLAPLEDHFVVVNWDQPGTGKSYGAVPAKELKVQRFTNDAYVLGDMMRRRFNQDKIYVMGLSWGTIVGINLAKQHPDIVKAYIGSGQMVNTTENDRYGYDLAKEISRENNDTATLRSLKKNGPPPYRGAGLGLKYALYNDVLFRHMDSPTIPLIMILVPQFAREYGYIDKVNFGRGLFESFTVLYPQLENLDFTVQVPQLEVPVFFLAGAKDVNAVSSIVKRYYDILRAPKKKLIWLQSGHGATAEETHDVLVNTVLREAE
jgi:pimeloyl-ACP methyl ester carboxylesterase